MIRLIQRRLIIPQGDTGTFTIPVQGTMTENDVAILSIFDPLTQKTMITIKGAVDNSNNILTFEFQAQDTLNIEPSKRYLWDIKIYRNASYDEQNHVINHADLTLPFFADSYYAAFKLPTCEIRAVTSDVQK